MGRPRGEGQGRTGRVLRYVVTATARTVSARLLEVPASSPIGTLEGTRNLVAFTTRRYRTEPLVISGPGAGAEVTAAGILNDIYSFSTVRKLHHDKASPAQSFTMKSVKS